MQHSGHNLNTRYNGDPKTRHHKFGFIRVLDNCVQFSDVLSIILVTWPFEYQTLVYQTLLEFLFSFWAISSKLDHCIWNSSYGRNFRPFANQTVFWVLSPSLFPVKWFGRDKIHHAMRKQRMGNEIGKRECATLPWMQVKERGKSRVLVYTPMPWIANY